MNYTREQLLEFCTTVGEDVSVHTSVVFFGNRVRLGSRVRIDAFTIVSGDVTIGNNCHIASGVRLFGGSAGIVLEDFAGISSGVSVYTGTDDYVDGHLTGPTIPEPFKKVRTGPVNIRRHCVVGAHSVVLPGVSLGFGATVGALSLVNRSLDECVVAAGVPAKPVKLRNRDRLLELEKAYLENLSSR